ncbi:MAG: hypothetical protein B7Z60_05075 [Ferrovum sp. 37-45-19]|nr:MAG: hypothetical protein B7Z65_04930 [Ferrovum sp. 21-44-67]OYV94321.1 MAG: hypothetical protein B7Z60_05075 [Ferrovum sp. 37-45-19]OZB32376.1 MAG: hypothetical protein B7X47_06650 [Ferrovum sp. 34-44-207]HQT80575.1 transglycosylase SLT domain-containing protein [Ferrovaceae bacterium]HQU06680.1 transglycosylase SLT domain-containing protein [Ferrovaceae bacterium]
MKVFLIVLWLSLLTLPRVICANDLSLPDNLLIRAYHAHLQQQLNVLQSVITELGDDELADYPRYWYLVDKINQGGAVNTVNQVWQFKKDFPHSPLYKSLHNALAYALYNSHQEALFLATLEEPDQHNVNLLCAKLSLTLNDSSSAALVQEAKRLWLENPDNHFCSLLIGPLRSVMAVDQHELWQSLNEALYNHQDLRSRLINEALPKAEQLRERDWRQANSDPKHFLSHMLSYAHLNPGQTVLLLHALQLLAKEDPIEASHWWHNHASIVDTNGRDWGWAEIAYQGALKLDPHALSWFHLAKLGIDQEDYRASHVRTALREEQWQEVLKVIDSMPLKEQKLRMWQYWKAQSLNHLHQESTAQPILQALAKESDFYGLLTQDELHLELPHKVAIPPVSKQEIATLEPTLQRAIRLHRLNIKPMDRLEWNLANQPFNARQHLIAAHIAYQLQWFDRAIFSASQAGPMEDINLSYPTPFASTLEESVKKRHLDEAWVYGLIRQESLFAPQARSRTGAQGLMQIMPPTARWIAKHLSLKRFLPDQTTELATNLNLGTYYLQHLLDQLNTTALATAGYNAGPRRVKQWLNPTPMDGVIFIETIPFNETRDYVKRVMANTVLYSKRLNKPYIPLKERIGIVPTVANLQPIHGGEP